MDSSIVQISHVMRYGYTYHQDGYFTLAGKSFEALIYNPNQTCWIFEGGAFALVKMNHRLAIKGKK